MKFYMNGIGWNVYKVHANSYELTRSDGSVTVGMCDGKKCAIFLCENLRGAFLRKVFIHEVCHSAIFSYGLELDMEQEEFLCDFVASYGDEIFEVVDNMFAVLKKRVV